MLNDTGIFRQTMKSIIENVTLNSTSSDDNTRFEHGNIMLKISMGFSFTVASLLLYLILALTCHGYKTKSIIGHRDSKLSCAKRAATLVNSLLLSDAIFTLAFVSTAFPQAAKSLTNKFCLLQDVCRMLFYSVAITSIYIALWIRVYRILYAHPVLKRNIPKTIRAVNYSSLVFLSFCVIIVMGLGFIFYEDRSIPTPYGCGEPPNTTGRWKFFLLVASMLAFQTSLLVSFVYPLCMHKRKLSESGIKSRFVKTILKRSAVVVVVCVPSDIAAACVSYVYNDPIWHAVYIAYSLNLIINLFGGVVSTADWRDKLFPFGGRFTRKQIIRTGATVRANRT